MGLSVIANISTTASTPTTASTADAGTGVPGEFAALLSGQTMAAMLAQGNGPSTDQAINTAAAEAETLGEKAPGDSLQAFDPAALVALMGNAQMQPAAKPVETRSLVLDEASDGSLKDMALSDDLNKRRQENVLADTAKSAARDLLAGKGGTPGGPLAADALAEVETANIAAPGELPGNSPAFSSSLSAVMHRQDAVPNPQTRISTPLHAEAWPQQFGEKVVWMAKNDQQTAQININPPQLGPVQITLSLSGDQATAVFASPHAEVRQAIESSLPQLREMLSSAGINLGDANVGANLAQQNPNNAFQTPNRAQSSLENAILPANDNAPVAGIATPLHHGRGLVDLFA